MSRLTQFIDYINKDKEAEPVVKLTDYTSLTIVKEVQEARKKYKKGAVLTQLLKDIQEARTIRIKQGLRN